MALDPDNKAADLEALFNEAAEACQYDPREEVDGEPVAPVEIEALFGRARATDQEGNVVADRLFAWVRVSDFATPPAKRNFIIRNGETWEITGAELTDGGLGRLTLEHASRPVPR